MLYISHDEMLLENTANVIIHLEQLRRKTLPRYTVARMGYRRYVEERLSNSPTRSRVAKKEREEERKRQEKLRKITSRRYSTSWTTSPTRTGTTWGRC